MSETTVDTSKRTWLIASSCAGAVGGVAVAVPF
ncbi:MAG: ubiquinol-cytochrome c reductase iron-sulfur subunit, partial [Betaproteobacteria bacterium]|nr:ubiquinol-cytochrome c reductase iron-sulfur subunit [Betaproteobacteria bacterium]